MKKIMIVDDSPTILSVMKKYLSNSGYQVETVVDSGTFFDGRAEAFHPDLLIIDINMPQYDGFYLLEHLKKKNLFPGTKIVMCSTKFFDHDISAAKDLGADDFLVKPFNDKQLIEKISSILG
ncbi:MAG: response regulator [Desulfobacteraceae bacterium]|nr:response regulator [Desulfobacteraceae bacterium]